MSVQAQKNQYLTDIANDAIGLALANGAFITAGNDSGTEGQEPIIPIQPVDSYSFEYEKVDEKGMIRVETAHSGHEPTRTIEHSTVWTPGNIPVDYRIGVTVGDREVKNAGSQAAAEVKAANKALYSNFLNYDVAVIAKMNAATHTQAAGTAWNASGGDPVKNLIAANKKVFDNSGAIANAVAMHRDLYQYMVTNPVFKEYIRGDASGMVTRSQVEEALTVLLGSNERVRLFVGGQRFNSAGQTQPATFTAGNTIANNVCYVFNRGSTMQGGEFIGALRQFAITDREGVFTAELNDPAARLMTVQHALIRNTILTNDGAICRITGAA